MLRQVPCSLLLLGLSACQGTLTVFGDPWGEPAAADDDSTGDDDTADDDTSDDDTGDDDTPVGPLDCGPAPELTGVDDARIYTGRAEVVFDDSDVSPTGGGLAASWTGCEALHVVEAGELRCSVRWDAVGASYAGRLEPEASVVRLQMDFVLDEDACGGAVLAQDRAAYFRLAVPFDGETAEIRVADDQDKPPTSMDLWALGSWDGTGSPPEQGTISYQSEPTGP